MNVDIEKTWKAKLIDEFEKDYFINLTDFIRNEYQNKIIYPPPNQIFRAFNICRHDKVRVVIIGQDPYHGPRQANGLCFSVNENISIPPSLKNIFKEIVSDIGGDFPDSGDLTHWAEQGVLMLNATLTVESRIAGSHQKKGWEEFTDSVIKKLSNDKEGLVFLLWGNYAKNKGVVIDRSKHLVLESAHPSPFSANQGFFGTKHFSKTNDYLLKKLDIPIDWIRS
jgi:uracil-DNA glycosylase